MRAVLGHVHGIAGHTKEAKSILDSLRFPTDGSTPVPQLLAVVCSGLGRYDEALTYLEQAYEERDGILLYVNVDLFGGIDRNNPRFSSLLKKIGLTE